MTYSANPYIAILDQDAQKGIMPRMDEVANQRTRTIKSGPIKEIESYPIWDTRAQATAAKSAMGETREAQKRLNKRNAIRKMERKANANFGPGDMLMTLTYPANKQPRDEVDAARQIANYIKRYKTMWSKKHPRGDCKYIYVTERTESEKYGVRYHHHMMISGSGMDRDEAEARWHDYTKGICNARRYQKQTAHLTGWAVYMQKFKATQARATRRAWCASKNLIDPIERATISETKVSKRRAQRMAAGGIDAAREVLAKMYPGHEILEVEVKTSEFVQGVYLYAKMRMPDNTESKARWAG